MIPFNKPYYSGNEIAAISRAMETGILTGDTYFTRYCEEYLEKKYGFPDVFLTNSCTMALEMAAILANITEGDEVIVPSYTYVSTANAFALRGAKIVFADSKKDQPHIDEEQIESLISPRTKAIVVVHYAGVACNMNVISEIAKKHRLLLIEDAAQCIGSYYGNAALGSIGDIACFSFHETKNIHCGEGGFISVNNSSLVKRAEIISNKGTNRSAFIRGEVNKYEWVDLGYSSVPSALSSAFLMAQLESIETVEKKRKMLWDLYKKKLSVLEEQGIQLPFIPEYSSNNAHIFYLICRTETERNELIEFLRKNNIQAVFHYQSLHSSPYFSGNYRGKELINAERYSACLLRLPLFFDLSTKELDLICNKVLNFYTS
jgi:dTDP-4-amino-4,6-dideoxygalactose transaminase